MVRRILIGAALLALLAIPPSADAAFLRVADARAALVDYLGAPLPGARHDIRRCDRDRATVVICRYTVDQQAPSPEGASFTYHGIAYIRIRRGRVVVRDPMLSEEAAVSAPSLAWANP